jgi:hypothetical protein
MKIKIMIVAMAALGSTHFAAAQTVDFGGSVKAFLAKPDQTSAVRPPRAEPVETASQGVGLLLYRKMNAQDRLALTSCYDGQGCLELMKIEAASFGAFSDSYQANVPADFIADKTLGDMANKLASDTCGASAYSINVDGGAQAITQLVYAENLALEYLRSIQAAAGRKDKNIAYCQFAVSY